MEDVLRFHRLQGEVQEVLGREKITASALEDRALILGTDAGNVHVFSFASAGPPLTLRAHDRPVNDVAVDARGSTIGSCSDNGSVVLFVASAEERENREITVHFNEPVKCLALEDFPSAKRDRSFVIGTQSGQVIYRRTVRHTQENSVLFRGAGSAVSCVSWRGKLVAWADATMLRIMDISLQAALCYLEAPAGVSPHCPIPCRLFWESENALWVAWADSVRTLHFSHSESPDIVARSVFDWTADCIVCGLSTFDADHLVLLGYLPPDDDPEFASASSTPASLGMSSNALPTANLLELQLVRRDTGKVMIAEVVPMAGEMVMSGPWGFSLLTSYQSSDHSNDCRAWNLQDAAITSVAVSDNTATTNRRGGARGLSPVSYLIAPQDVVVGRVRDVNDRVVLALKQGDFLAAANLAVGDPYSLTLYKVHDLVALYIEDLMEQNAFVLAGAEVGRLVGKDTLAWEAWISAFALREQLPALANHIPYRHTVLSPKMYQTVISSFLEHRQSASLFDVVRKWTKDATHNSSSSDGSLFDLKGLISRLERLSEPDDLEVEILAMLYLHLKQTSKAVNAYLSIKKPRKAVPDADGNLPYCDVFEVIEKEKLFDLVREKIINLVRLSQELAAGLLIRCIEVLPIPFVARQLRIDRYLLHWYLNMLFTRIPDTYNAYEFSEYHLMQAPLYAEFAPKFVKPPRRVVTEAGVAASVTISTSAGNGANEDDVGESVADATNSTSRLPESDFLKFLRGSAWVDLDAALKECEKKRPPLFPEIIYILAKSERQQDALILLLREIGDVELAVEFVEIYGQQLEQLPSILIEYAVQHQEFMADLLNYVGVSSLNPKKVFAEIPKNTYIPQLRQKLMRVLTQYKFQMQVYDRTYGIMSHDHVGLLRQYNQGQRRAIKVDGTLRCVICARPLFMPPGPIPTSTTLPTATKDSSTPAHHIVIRDAQRLGIDGQVWGNSAITSTIAGGVVVFSNKTACHRYCLESVRLQVGLEPSQF